MKSKYLRTLMPFFCAIAVGGSFARAESITEYEVGWDFTGLPFEVSTYQLLLTEVRRVSETGVLLKTTKLPGQRRLEDGKFELRSGEKAVLVLVVENKSAKTIRFSVAPHSTHPGASALGFSFSCLCNGHVYEVPARKKWYRIMVLETKASESTPQIKLRHRIFEVQK